MLEGFPPGDVDVSARVCLVCLTGCLRCDGASMALRLKFYSADSARLSSLHDLYICFGQPEGIVLVLLLGEPCVFVSAGPGRVTDRFARVDPRRRAVASRSESNCCAVCHSARGRSAVLNSCTIFACANTKFSHFTTICTRVQRCGALFARPALRLGEGQRHP